MTTGFDANQKMQEGIKLYREGKPDEAYMTFQQLVRRDPNNEFGWIWVSVTSSDPAEKRAALNRALEINPNSSHAKDALRDLDLRAAAKPANADTPTQRIPRPPIPPLPYETPSGIPPEGETDPLEALRQSQGGKKGKKKGKAAPVVEVAPPGTAKARRQQRIQTNAQRLRRVLLVALVAVACLALIYLLFNRRQENANAPDNTAVADVTTTAAPATTTVEPTTTAALTTAEPTTAVTTTAPATTAAVTTTAAPATTTAASTTAAATSAAATSVVPGQAAVGSPSEQVQQYLQAGRQSEAAGDYKAAITSINQALRIDGRNVPANLELGNAYMSAPNDQAAGVTNRYAEAVKAFQVVTNQAPTWAGGWTRLGEALAANNQVPDAIKAYTRSLELDPNGSERWLALANLYERNNQQAEATYARQRAQGANVTPPPGAPK